MMRPRHPRAIGALALVSGLLSGCSGLFGQTPLEFYTLSPAPVASGTATASGGPVFAVAPVRVPQYLSQRSIVTRSGPTQLDLAENDVWAAPLSDTIGSVLSENISTMIPSEQRTAHHSISLR